MASGFRGVDAMRKKLRQVAQAQPQKIKAALYREAQIDMTEAKRRTPVAPDGGTLRASGKVDEPFQKGTNIIVILHFGGPSIDYAIAVHEHLSSHSPPSWIGITVHWTQPGTGPKFLESVINESRATMLRRLARRVRL